MPELIDTPAALEKTLDVLAPHSRIACDTESDSFFAYKPKVCLIQLSVPGHDFLVDPLADLDLAPLGELVGDPDRVVIFHAAENDVIQLQHEFNWRMPGLYDTQIACFVLGLPPYSLAGVLEERFGVKLDKSQQRSDWAQRPLSSKQVEYAAEDTRYLIELHEERRRGNCTERVFRGVARSYLISPEVLGALSANPDQVEDRLSSAYLLALAGRVIQDLSELRARSQSAGKPLPTISANAEIRFACAEERDAFAEDLLHEIAKLVREYHDESAEGGRSYSLFLGAHPSLRRKSGVSGGTA